MSDQSVQKDMSGIMLKVSAAIAIAGIAFAGGRASMQRAPSSVQEAMQMAQAGKLPFAPAGAANAAGPGSGNGFGPAGALGAGAGSSRQMTQQGAAGNGRSMGSSG